MTSLHHNTHNEVLQWMKDLPIISPIWSSLHTDHSVAVQTKWQKIRLINTGRHNTQNSKICLIMSLSYIACTTQPRCPTQPQSLHAECEHRYQLCQLVFEKNLQCTLLHHRPGWCSSFYVIVLVQLLQPSC